LSAACGGRQEDAGERIDPKSGATGGESSILSGPAERRGEELDRQASERDRAAEGKTHLSVAGA
jgi:hypothetical protein